MHTVMAQSVAGKSVAVVGVGSIGLMACKIASVAGALSVIAIDPQQHKRNLALRFGRDGRVRILPRTAGRRNCSQTPGSQAASMWFWKCRVAGLAFSTRSNWFVREAKSRCSGFAVGCCFFNLSESIIFKSVTVRGINGRLMFVDLVSM